MALGLCPEFCSLPVLSHTRPGSFGEGGKFPLQHPTLAQGLNQNPGYPSQPPEPPLLPLLQGRRGPHPNCTLSGSLWVQPLSRTFRGGQLLPSAGWGRARLSLTPCTWIHRCPSPTPTPCAHRSAWRSSTSNRPFHVGQMMEDNDHYQNKTSNFLT